MATLPRQRASRSSVAPPLDVNETRPQNNVALGRRNFPPKRRRLPSSVVTGFSLALFLVLALLHHAWQFLVIVGDDSKDSSRMVSKHYGLRQEKMNAPLRTAAPPSRPILTAFLESDTLPQDMHNSRMTSADKLKRIEYPNVKQCSTIHTTWPIDDFPGDDPFLPWIHDYFPTNDGQFIQFVAQNKRRCDTGADRTDSMKHWEPQMALFQPVPVRIEAGGQQIRLASPKDATHNETRFICRFHDDANNEYTTMSEFSFNYEYVSWRKDKQSMFVREGKDVQQFWLSQLLFRCPVPNELVDRIRTGSHVQNDQSSLYLDLIPIRTPARYEQFLFTEQHVPASMLASMGDSLFDPTKIWGDSHVLPALQDSGRWANMPICPSPEPEIGNDHDRKEKPHKLVACTWSAASYTRRGDAVTMGDTSQRLREWISFHLMVGFDHLHIYDNTAVDGSEEDELPLHAIASEFPGQVTYHRWPCQVCNNNRPNHKNPGERSSQYAAEASCRERYGPSTDWLAFIDTDEYLVPMMSDTWQPILDKMDERKLKILKMRSSRTKPRPDLMEVSRDQSTCVETNPKENITQQPCIEPHTNETFLRTYNCEFIKPPRPDRFERAMKQIYRPDHVWNHFVHYSTVTADVARLYKDFGPDEPFSRSVHAQSWIDKAPEVFLDELTEGTLVHTKSVLPSETIHRDRDCQLKSKFNCALGYPCPDHVEFSDKQHKENAFHDDEGKYCNCWMNHKVEDVFVPKLEAYLASHSKRSH